MVPICLKMASRSVFLGVMRSLSFFSLRIPLLLLVLSHPFSRSSHDDYL